MMEQDRRDAVFGGLPFGVCLVSMEEERILYGNRTFLDMAGASSLESLLESSGGVFRRLVEMSGMCRFRTGMRRREISPLFSASGYAG